MGTVLKIAAALIVIGGLWFWAKGHSVTDEVEARANASNASAAAVLAPEPDGRFDQEGTIVLDMTQGQNGTPYILYTEYNEQGKPAVKTKRLIFPNRDACAEKDLPCATNQPGVPVRPDDAVRVVGVVEDDTVTVSDLHRL